MAIAHSTAYPRFLVLTATTTAAASERIEERLRTVTLYTASVANAETANRLKRSCAPFFSCSLGMRSQGTSRCARLNAASSAMIITM